VRTYEAQNKVRPSSKEVYKLAAESYRAVQEHDIELERRANSGGEDAMRAIEYRAQEFAARKLEQSDEVRRVEDAELAQRAQTDPAVRQRLAWLGGTPEEMKAAGLAPTKNYYDRITGRGVKKTTNEVGGARQPGRQQDAVVVKASSEETLAPEDRTNLES
jgi:hypothetical protein